MLFVNGPYGRAVRFEVDEKQASTLYQKDWKRSLNREATLRKFWVEHVEPKLYIREGKKKNGIKDGLWVTRLLSGEKYKEGKYVNGKRHGKWTTYYKNGSIQNVSHYNMGQRHGLWIVYDGQGHEIDRTEWGHGFPVNKTVEYVSPLGAETSMRGGPEGAPTIDIKELNAKDKQ